METPHFKKGMFRNELYIERVATTFVAGIDKLSPEFFLFLVNMDKNLITMSVKKEYGRYAELKKSKIDLTLM